jgi:hypothetical protein
LMILSPTGLDESCIRPHLPARNLGVVTARWSPFVASLRLIVVAHCQKLAGGAFAGEHCTHLKRLY